MREQVTLLNNKNKKRETSIKATDDRQTLNGSGSFTHSNDAAKQAASRPPELIDLPESLIAAAISALVTMTASAVPASAEESANPQKKIDQEKSSTKPMPSKPKAEQGSVVTIGRPYIPRYKACTVTTTLIPINGATPLYPILSDGEFGLGEASGAGEKLSLPSGTTTLIYSDFEPRTNELTEFMNNLQRKIMKFWTPSSDEAWHGLTVIEFQLNQQGELSTFKTAASSCNLAYDEAAMSAVQKSAPFQPLPKNYNPMVIIRLSFERHQMEPKQAF